MAHGIVDIAVEVPGEASAWKAADFGSIYAGFGAEARAFRCNSSTGVDAPAHGLPPVRPSPELPVCGVSAAIAFAGSLFGCLRFSGSSWAENNSVTDLVGTLIRMQDSGF